ncbi:Aste57867_23164 [Aphanomyces stellatus]|uniref:Aste57867_23164 protein n=1 Tax=Aphanomyces stellatus TaxID=120398 RepID=A0A485LM22_9STRA|nr:hypothetical protein As57867_023093 [Aphanomyces stellatus]VFT99812.1 Aste57867_23164 [Aphanomyces stellatus]
MELETFLETQPWLAYDEHVTTTCASSGVSSEVVMHPLDTMLHGMFFVNDHSFCTFSPSHGDQTQFDCALFVRDGAATNKRDASGALKPPSSALLYLRVHTKMYWIDHVQIQKPPEVIDQPPLPAHIVFELGSIRLRMWMNQDLSKEEQVSRLAHVVLQLRSKLRKPSSRPTLASPHMRLMQHRQSALEAYAAHLNASASQRSGEDKLFLFQELCGQHGVSMTSPTASKDAGAIGKIMAALLFHGDAGASTSVEVDILQAACGLTFSDSCAAHDDCYLLATSSVPTCTTSLWHAWDSYLDAASGDDSVGDVARAMASIEAHAKLFCQSMVSPHLRAEWSHHAAHTLAALRQLDAHICQTLFPVQMFARDDEAISSHAGVVNAVKQARKKAMRDELAVLLLPGQHLP